MYVSIIFFPPYQNQINLTASEIQFLLWKNLNHSAKMYDLPNSISALWRSVEKKKRNIFEIYFAFIQEQSYVTLIPTNFFFR